MKGPERKRQKRITDALELFGWLWVHNRPAYTAKGYRTAIEGHKGFPDIVAVKDILLIVEVKANGKWLDDDQQVWGDALFNAAISGAYGCGESTRCEGLHFDYRVVNDDESEAELLSLISGGRLT